MLAGMYWVPVVGLHTDLLLLYFTLAFALVAVCFAPPVGHLALHLQCVPGSWFLLPLRHPGTAGSMRLQLDQQYGWLA